ncbi:MAG: hypothetical protein IPJ36_15780 [Simplicispira sp.]|nr:hypothetical protein [Simplicispira sp.]
MRWTLINYKIWTSGVALWLGLARRLKRAPEDLPEMLAGVERSTGGTGCGSNDIKALNSQEAPKAALLTHRQLER